MSRILVLYGTTDGHTAKVARTLGETLRTHGAEVDVIEAGTAPLRPQDYAGIIVAASVHAGGYQRAVQRWVRTHADALHGKPTAFVSVCLGVLQRDPKCSRSWPPSSINFSPPRDGSPQCRRRLRGRCSIRETTGSSAGL